MKKVLLGLLVITTITSCTQNNNARLWGGEETIHLETGERLINVTWKGKYDSDLWILTKQDTTKPTTYSFKEKSNFGVMDGEVIIIEK